MSPRKQIKISRSQHLRLVVMMVLLCVATIIVFNTISSQQHHYNGYVQQSYNLEMVVDGLELPKCYNADMMVVNRAGRYTFLYDTLYRQSAWVAYLLTRKDVQTRGVKRQNDIRVDPQIKDRGWPTATNDDYKRSGYDRGHLLPSADRDDASVENSATFLLSNMSPQTPSLNRGVWRELEEQVRVWALKYDSVYVVTGGELCSEPHRIGSGVGVPSRFFKALLSKDKQGNYHAIAYLIPNYSKVEGSFTDYSLTVNELEDILNYDLFYNIPDNQEEIIEETADLFFWR